MDKEALNQLMRCDLLKSKIERLEPGNAKTIINIVESECIERGNEEENLLENIYRKLLQGVDYSEVKTMEDIIYVNAKFDMTRNWLTL